MKRYFILFCCSALFALATTSCDDFLDIEPIGKVTPTTVEDYNKVLAEAYRRIPADRGLTSFRTDEFLLVPPTVTDPPAGYTSVYDLQSYGDLWKWNDEAPQSGTASPQYANCYLAIFTANAIIEKEGSIVGSASAVKQLVGEAYMMRAYMHFVLVNLYAPHYTKCDPATTKGVVLKLDTDSEELLPRSTVQQVYTSILSDLTEAEKRLNVASFATGKNYRFTTLSLEAFRSRLYLYMGKWDESFEAAKRVIEARKLQLGTAQILENLNTSDILPNAYNSVESIVALEQNVTAAYAKAGRMSAELRNQYVYEREKEGRKDLRRMKCYTSSSPSLFVVKKGGSIDYRCTFRMGEVYLNAAEAACRANDTDTACVLLLELQKNRFYEKGFTDKDTTVVKLTQDELLEEILNERFRELAFEGHRWFDLRRTTQPELTHVINGETYTLSAGDSRYTLRFPQSAIEANPELLR